MSRPCVLFTIASISLLISAVASNWINPAGSLIFNFRSKGYGFSPASICVFQAAFLCLFAAAYSFWIFPMNQKAALWHFWLTFVGVALFWIAYCTFSALVKDEGAARGGAKVTLVALTWLVSFLLLLVAQGVFVANVLSGIAKLNRRA